MARLLCLSLVAERARRLRGVSLRSAAPTTCTSRMTGGCCPRVTLHSRRLASPRGLGSNKKTTVPLRRQPWKYAMICTADHMQHRLCGSAEAGTSESGGADQTDMEPDARRAQTALARWWCTPVEVQAGDPRRLVRVEDLSDLLAKHVLAHGRDLSPHLPCVTQAHKACSEHSMHAQHTALQARCPVEAFSTAVAASNRGCEGMPQSITNDSSSQCANGCMQACPGSRHACQGCAKSHHPLIASVRLQPCQRDALTRPLHHCTLSSSADVRSRCAR